eukprot:TRINITY_DN1430_c0_g1_i3.p1 TRINITY_DN1430_c0_g1~~TRINITY_DN1430_c0_g1_i3.p1  ORF type:complete len:740 (+),score=104.61 TRINITY_DN1430_c0_g1_i3:85-2304(+)
MSAEEIFGTHLGVPGTPPHPPPKGMRKRRLSAVSSNGGMLMQKVERFGDGKTRGKSSKMLRGKSVDTIDWLDKSGMETDPVKQAALDQLGKSVSLLSRERRYSTACSILAAVATLLVTFTYVFDDHLIAEILLSVTTVFHLGFALGVHLIQYRRAVLWRPEWRKDTGMSDDQLTRLVIEAFGILIHKPPGVDQIPKIINVVVLLRLFTLMRSLRDMSFASSMGSILVGALCNTRMDAFFVYKTRLFSSPILTMTVTSGFGLVLLSFLTWFVEQSYGTLNLAQCFWFTFVTATTVGYGDYTPSSVGGKLVGVISALYGIVITAILVSVVQHKLTMTGIQKQIILFLSEVQRVQQTKVKAARVVRQAVIYSQLKAIVRKSGKPIPEHRTYISMLSSSTTRKVLYKAWINLQEAVDEMRTLRKETSAAWAHISVLDVLHADSSDILAQNTVLQYLMRPADEDLSAMLRVGKHNPIANKRRRYSDEDQPQPVRVKRAGSRRPSRDVRPPQEETIIEVEEDRGAADADADAEADAVELKEIRSEDSNGSSCEEEEARSPKSERSHGSITSLTSTNSVRTAASTAAMVDMLKLAVSGSSLQLNARLGRVGVTKTKRLRRVFDDDDEDATSAFHNAHPEGEAMHLTSPAARRFGIPAPGGLRSPGTMTNNSTSMAATLDAVVSSQRRLEAMMVHMMKELNVAPYPSPTTPPTPPVHEAIPGRALPISLEKPCIPLSGKDKEDAEAE